METGHPSTQAVNSGRQLGQWKLGNQSLVKIMFLKKWLNSFPIPVIIIMIFKRLVLLNIYCTKYANSSSVQAQPSNCHIHSSVLGLFLDMMTSSSLAVALAVALALKMWPWKQKNLERSIFWFLWFLDIIFFV